MKFADQALLVLEAQLRIYRNLLGRRGKVASAFNFLATAAWYGFACLLAVLVSDFFAAVTDMEIAGKILLLVLFGITAYWQLSPIFTVSFGLALDLKRLLIFPIRPNQFFLMELALCLPTSMEALIVTAGVIIGLVRNPVAPAGLVVSVGVAFLVFNLCLNVAFRALVSKVAVKRYWREGLVFVILLIALTPQLILISGDGDPDVSFVERFTNFDPNGVLPWTAAAMAMLGQRLPASLMSLGMWGLIALMGARGLFLRSLIAEPESPPSLSRKAALKRSDADFRARIASLLGRAFPQPLASLVEKEFLTYTRSPRFLTVFVMGFTFGIVVFLPIALKAGESPGFISRNFLTVVTAYAILLMSEMVFWNVFGLDRKASQVFFFAPIRLQTVFVAKNLVAFFIICFQVFVIAAVCSLIGVPVTPSGISEAVLAAIVLAINMFAVGNQSSVRYPAGVNPEQSWSTANKTKFRLVLMLLFPVVSLPTSLAYLARFAFDSDAAFYLGMLIAGFIALTLYLVSLDSAIEYARANREDMVDLLGTTDTAI